MLRRAIWQATLLAALGLAAAEPARAQPPNQPLTPEYVPAPAAPLPDVGTFGDLLFDLARPPDPAHPRGMTASNPDLALRAGSPALLPQAGRNDPARLNLLEQSTYATPLSDLPTGAAVVDFLDPTGEHKASDLHLRDLGVLAMGEQGPLQRTGRAVLGSGPAGNASGMLMLAGVSVAAAARLGTARAAGMGLPPRFEASLLDGRLDVVGGLRCDAQFANARVDASGRYHLLQLAPPRWQAHLQELAIELGGTAAREGNHLPSRWAKLRAGTSWLDAAVGLQGTTDKGPPVLSLEASAWRDAYRLRTQLSRQADTGVSQLMGSLAYRAHAGEFGFFVGEHTTQGLTLGILAMSTF